MSSDSRQITPLVIPQSSAVYNQTHCSPFTHSHFSTRPVQPFVFSLNYSTYMLHVLCAPKSTMGTPLILSIGTAMVAFAYKPFAARASGLREVHTERDWEREK